MKELLEYIVRNLVSEPDAVNVTEIDRDDEIVLEVRVSPSDMGKVIGKHGRIARELRTIIRSASMSGGRKYLVDILD